jgi:hydrogenase-4 membrane subunit HyfE
MILLAFGTALAWAAWILVLVRLNPYSDGLPALVLFFGSAAVAVAGTLTIAGFFLRYWLEREQVIFRQFAVASRQAIILTSGFLIVGILQLQGMLRIWSAGLVLLLVLIIELFIQAGTYRRAVHPHYEQTV